MRKTYGKNIFRTVRSTLSRFMAIFAIVALGVGFLAGLLGTTPDMRYSADEYFTSTKLFDLRVLSTLGLTDADAQALGQVEGVDGVMPAYSADMLLLNEAKEIYVTRLHSLPPDTSEAATDYLNRVSVIEGRLPKTAKECVIEQGSAILGQSLSVGDTLTVSPENVEPQDTLYQSTLTVVGIVESSYYFSMEREAASVGNGSIALVAYLPENAFSAKAYTHIYMTFADAREENSLTAAYDTLMEAATARVEALETVRAPARLEEIRSEAQVEITDAQAKLDDARKELDDGWIEYNDGKATADKELASAAQKLANGRKEVADGEEKLAVAELQIIGAQADIDSAKNQLHSLSQTTTKELDDAQTALDAQRQQVEPLRLGVEQADAAVAQAQGVVTQLTDTTIQLSGQIAALEAAIAAGDTSPETAGALATAQAGLAQAQAGLAQAQGGLAQAQAMSQQLHSQYDPAAAALQEGQTKIDQGRAALGQAVEAAIGQIAAGDAALLQGRKDYEQGEKDLAAAKKTLAEGQAEYNTEKAKADTELIDAKKKLDDGEIEWADGAKELKDAKQELLDLELPEWFILDRNTNVSFATFRGNAEKVEAIATVFPVFFFLVAALVALTTMTRMVEEERLQIGTMKALGYSKGAIIAKYILYASLASILGSATGLAVGFSLFPTVIWNAYGMMYRLPPLHLLFHANYALIASGAAIGCTLLATLNACWSTLMETPANLMRPRAPKAGKRILLERAGFLWKRMRFTHKVTARNLFRYKKRFFMTVVGIAGCTGLLVTGFGMRDSIGAIVNLQFSTIFTYDASIALPNSEAAYSEALQEGLHHELVDGTMSVHQEKSTNTYGKETFSTYLFVPENPKVFTSFVNLHTRIEQKPVAFSQTGIVITEKMSLRIGSGVGDTIALENSSGAKGNFRIDGVVENYVENYVYLSAETYEAAFGSTVDFNSLLLRMTENTPDTRSALATHLLKLEDVTSVNFITDIKDTFSSMMEKIDIIVMVLIISAGLLAFVVLYNLTNINITERSKEIATIKVLGFYDKEVQGYVYRESILLSLIGTLFGLGMGTILHQFVILQVEVDMVMFGRSVYPMSYLYSAALTLAFSLLVNFVMRGKLRRIDMVESMKAPE